MRQRPYRQAQEKHKEVNVAGSRKTRKRDIEKTYPKKDFIAKLRRLVDTPQRGEPFRIQVAGTRIAVPKQAAVARPEAAAAPRERGGYCNP